MNFSFDERIEREREWDREICRREDGIKRDRVREKIMSPKCKDQNRRTKIKHKNGSKSKKMESNLM